MVTWVTYATVFFTWVFAQVDSAYRLPPLPMIDGCFRVSPEPGEFRVQGEAVVLHCSGFERVLYRRQISMATLQAGSTYRIAKGNGTMGVAPEDEGRVRQRDRQLWLLPAQTSDSGQYTCIFRNATFCVAGGISLQVYEPEHIDMAQLSYPIFTLGGIDVFVTCPHLQPFNRTEEIQWYKDSSRTALPIGQGRYYREREDVMLISDVSQSDAGLYTCEVTVMVGKLQFKVSRTLKLTVQVSEPPAYIQTMRPNIVPATTPTRTLTLTPTFTRTPTLTPTSTSTPTFTLTSTSTPTPTFTRTPTLTPTSTPTPASGSPPSHNTVEPPEIPPPKIVSPVNGSVFEGPHGSGLEMECKVFTVCQSADSTVVTWLVDGQSVESSYLGGRAVQGGRGVTRVPNGCHVDVRLIIIGLKEEDTRAELKCVTLNQGGAGEVYALLRLEDSMSTWLAVAVVGVACFLLVVSVFLYSLLKPQAKTDYILARQNSTF